MGDYLNMAGNNKAAPNENYAREVLQLFTIGLVELNPDGSVVTDSQGNPVPSYTQATVTAFARVFTGWNLAAPSRDRRAELPRSDGGERRRITTAEPRPC